MISRFYAIAVNTFLETIRQPLFGVIILATGLLMIMNVAMAAYTLRDDDRLLIEAGLSTLLLAGLFLAVFSASAVLNREIENKTTLAVMSKPVSRPLFILGKSAGLFAALTLAYYLMFLFFALAQRHSVLQNSSDPWDAPVILIGGGTAILTLVVAALLNYLYGYQFSGTAMAIGVPVLTASMFVIAAFGKTFGVQEYWKGMVGGQVILAAILVYFAIMVLAALALAASTRFAQGTTLAICGIALVVGLIADYAVGQFSETSSLAAAVYRSIPNLAIFFVAEAFATEGVTIPPSYVLNVGAYAALLVAALLMLAIALFQRREVG